jgi:hypothetical protein
MSWSHRDRGKRADAYESRSRGRIVAAAAADLATADVDLGDLDVFDE